MHLFDRSIYKCLISSVVLSVISSFFVEHSSYILKYCLPDKFFLFLPRSTKVISSMECPQTWGGEIFKSAIITIRMLQGRPVPIVASLVQSLLQYLLVLFCLLWMLSSYLPVCSYKYVKKLRPFDAIQIGWVTLQGLVWLEHVMNPLRTRLCPYICELKVEIWDSFKYKPTVQSRYLSSFLLLIVHRGVECHTSFNF